MMSSVLTSRTTLGYEGPILFMEMTPGEWGPLYHVGNTDIKGSSDNIAKAYKEYARYSRVKRLRKKFSKDSKAPHLFEVFLESHKEEIEMDPEFSLLPYLQEFLPQPSKKLKEAYEKTSLGRWCGLTKPKNFKDADNLYALSHLSHKKDLHLYEIWLQVSSRDCTRPGAFLGKVRGGTSLQIKLNNHAIESISQVEKIDSWHLPSNPLSKK